MSYDPTKQFSLDMIQSDILQEITAQFTQKVYETGIPDQDSVIRNASQKVDPYLSIQFGDLQRIGGRVASGVEGDDYELPVYFQCIAPSASVARGLSNKLTRVILGYKTRFTGQTRKRPGGGMFPVQSSTGATDAFIAPSSYGIVVQLIEV